MTTIKFDKSVKYAGVRHDAHTAFDVKDEDVDELKKAGATIIRSTPATPPQTPNSGSADDGVNNSDDETNKSDEDNAQLKEALLDYTVPELTKFAEERGIDLQGKTRKADIYNIIVAAL